MRRPPRRTITRALGASDVPGSHAVPSSSNLYWSAVFLDSGGSLRLRRPLIIRARREGRARCMETSTLEPARRSERYTDADTDSTGETG
jgi:hypothetical protein